MKTSLELGMAESSRPPSNLAERIKAHVERSFRVRTESDQHGAPRSVFTHPSGLDFSIKGREELPVYPALDSRNAVTVIGGPVKLVDEWSRTMWAKRLGKSGGQKHVLIDRSVDGVIGLGQQLGTHAPENRAAVLDGLVAVMAQVHSNPNVPDGYCEALVVQALSGDPEAGRLVSEAQRDLAPKLAARQAERLPKSLGADVAPMNVNDLACVHATKYAPVQNTAGELEATTSFDAYPHTSRISFHVSLNHRVEGHSGGDWGDADLVYISPMKEMIAANGPPAVLADVDTYWMLEPGQRIRIPDPTVVRSGRLEPGQLFETVSDRLVLFRSGGYTGKDFLALYGVVQSEDQWSADELAPTGTTAMWLLEGLDSRMMDDALPSYSRRDGRSENIFVQLARKSPDASMQDICKEVVRRIPDEAFKGVEAPRHLARARLTAGLSKVVRGTMRGEISSRACRTAIVERGFKYREGGEHAWSGPGSGHASKQLQALAHQMGVGIGSHFHNQESTIETEFSRAANNSTDGRTHRFNWTEFAPDVSFAYEAALGPQLRAVYEAGFPSTEVVQHRQAAQTTAHVDLSYGVADR